MTETEQIEKITGIFSIELPNTVKSNIIVLFRDNNPDNWEKSNLAYVFRTPQECPFYPGYYYIAGFSRYVINFEGELITVKTGMRKKWITVKGKSGQKNITGGYKVSWGKPDNGDKINIARHRAMCLAFKPPAVHPGELHVNHENGIPGDDRLDNLEWMTPSANVQHAYNSGLYPNKVRPITAQNWITGVTIDFPTIQAACNELNFEHTLITGRLLRFNGIKYPDGWRFKDRNKSWAVLNEYVGQSVQHVSVMARDIFLNRVLIFHTINDAARELNIHPGAIRQQCVGKVMTPLRGYNFRLLEGFEGWPVYSDKHLKIFKDNPIYPGDGIEVYDVETNDHLFFTSAQECATHFNISPITASKLARYEGTRDKRYKFKLFRIRDVNIGPLTE